MEAMSNNSRDGEPFYSFSRVSEYVPAADSMTTDPASVHHVNDPARKIASGIEKRTDLHTIRPYVEQRHIARHKPDDPGRRALLLPLTSPLGSTMSIDLEPISREDVIELYLAGRENVHVGMKLKHAMQQPIE